MVTTTTKVMSSIIGILAIFLGIAVLLTPIIVIKNAWYLNENRTILANVFDKVKAKDGTYVDINQSHFLRVQFEKKLNSSNDITIYARAPNGSILYVYQKGLKTKIATFNVSKEGFYKVYLNLLKTTKQDTFDIQATKFVQIDYVVDPLWAGIGVDTQLLGPANNTFYPTTITPLSCNATPTNVTLSQMSYYVKDSTMDALDRDPNLLAYYKMEKNSNITHFPDETGRYNATCLNASQPDTCANYTSKGAINGGALFSTNVSALRTGLTKTQISGKANMTYSLWFNARSIVYGADTGSTDRSNLLSIGGNDLMLYFSNVVGNKLSFEVYNATSNTIVRATSTTSLNTWYHVVVTTNETEKRIYINGVLDKSAVDNRIMVTTTNNPLLIGGDGLSYKNASFNGTIDQVRIFNRSLNASEVLSLYNAGQATYNITEWREFPKTASQTMNFSYLNLTRYTFSYWLNSRGTGTDVQIFNGIIGADNTKTTFFTYTTSDSVNFRMGNGTAYTSSTYGISKNVWYHVVGTFDQNDPTPATKLYVDGVLRDSDEFYGGKMFFNTTGLVAWYRLDSNLEDSSGNGLTAINSSTLNYTTGVVKDGIGLNGIIGSANSTWTWNTYMGLNYTVSAWIRPASSYLGAYEKVISSDSGSTGTRNFQLNYEGTRVQFILFQSSGGSLSDSYCYTALTGWHMLTANVYSGKNTSIFVDGVYCNSSAAGTANINTFKFQIGEVANVKFNGTIDDARVYNRTLSADEINLLYNESVNRAGVYTSGGILKIGAEGGNGNPHNGSLDEIRVYNVSLNSSQVTTLFNEGRTQQLCPGNMLCSNLVEYIPLDSSQKSFFDDGTRQDNGGSIYNYSFTNYTFTQDKSKYYSWNCWVDSLQNLGDDGDTSFYLGENFSVNITFVNQYPADVTNNNTLNGVGLNITYNVSSNDLNNNSILLFYKTNRSTSDIGIYTNGTPVTGFFSTGYSNPLNLNGLVMYYPFNKDSRDYAGTNDATNYGSSQATGKVGGAYSFNESVYLKSQSNFSQDFTRLTISIWVYRLPVPAGVNPTIFDLGNLREYSNRSYSNIVTATNKVRFNLGNGSGTANIDSISSISIGVWTHIVYTWNGSEMLIYMNGTLEPVQANQSGLLKATINGIAFGRSYKDVGGFFNGSLDDFRIYNRTLSTQEIVDLYNYGSYRMRLEDNAILPGTYNLNERIVEITAHSRANMGNTSTFINTQLLNVRNDSYYNLFEIMVNRTTASLPNPGELWYCNSTYRTGTITNSNACTLIQTITNDTYNHCHPGSETCHILIQFQVANGSIGIVKITNTSRFLFRGATGGGWSYSYVATTARVGATQLTSNGGNTWTNQTYTIDAHIHQFDGTDAVNYYLCANDTYYFGGYSQYSCSALRYDIFNISGIAPLSPIVYAPKGQYRIYNLTNVSVLAQWTEAVSPNAYPMVNYTVDVLNSDLTLNISLGNTTALNTTIVLSNGFYIIRVVAWDNFSLPSPPAYSSVFDVITIYPNIQFDSSSIANNSVISTQDFFVNVTTDAVLSRYNLLPETTDYVIFMWDAPNSTFVDIFNETYPDFTTVYDTPAFNYNVYSGGWDTSSGFTELVKGREYALLSGGAGAVPISSYYVLNGFIKLVRPIGDLQFALSIITNDSTTFTSTNRYILDDSSIGDYVGYYNYSICDIYAMCNSTETRVLIYDTVAPTIKFTTPTLSSGSLRKQSYIEINVTYNETNLANMSFNLYNTGGLYSSVNQTETNYTFTGLSDGLYFYNVTITDRGGLSNSTETRNITLNTTYPQIQFVSPTSSGNQTSKSILANITYQDILMSNITLRLYNSTGLMYELPYYRPGYCFQEFTNRPTTCGGVEYGNYTDPRITVPFAEEVKARDGNYGTYGGYLLSPTLKSEYQMIYITPLGANTSSIWRVKRGSDNGTSATSDLAFGTCMSQNTFMNRFRVAHDSSATTRKNSCFNYLNQETILETDTGGIFYALYEEAINWSIGTELFYNFTGLSDGQYYMNATICDGINQCNTTATQKIFIGTNSMTYSSPLPYGLRFVNCSPQWSAFTYPNGQTNSIAALNFTNTGSFTTNVTISYSGTMALGWELYACSNNTGASVRDCRQSSPNQTVTGNGICSLNYSGYYSPVGCYAYPSSSCFILNDTYFFDGNYSTFGYLSATSIGINFTKPNNQVVGAKVGITIGGNWSSSNGANMGRTINLTVPNSCFGNSSQRVIGIGAYSWFGFQSISCSNYTLKSYADLTMTTWINSTDYLYGFHNGTDNFYEINMYWQYVNSSSCTTLTTANQSIGLYTPNQKGASWLFGVCDYTRSGPGVQINMEVNQ